MPISLNPETFTAGGMLNDVDIEIVASRFGVFTYNTGQSVPALILTFKDEEGETHEQVYSAGKMEDFVPSIDGKQLEQAPGSKRSQLNNNSNIGIFIKSLADAGFDLSKLHDGNADNFIGIRAHVVRKAFGKQANSDKNREVLVIESLLEAKAGNASPSGANSAASNDTDDAIATITQIILENGGSINKAKILPAVFAALKDHPNRNGIIKVVSNPSFVAANFALNGADVSLKG